MEEIKLWKAIVLVMTKKYNNLAISGNDKIRYEI